MSDIPEIKFDQVRMFDDSLYFEEGKNYFDRESGFNHLFPDLPPFWKGQDYNDVLQRLKVLGSKGGLMDAKDPLITITNPLDANESINPDNPESIDQDKLDVGMTVGFTFLGQFLDHDITLDEEPLNSDGRDFPNGRTPFFDLDSIYGRSPNCPDKDPYKDGKFKLDLVVEKDLPRNSTMLACIADKRNDENVIISQLHLAFMHFHNEVIDYLVDQNKDLKGDNLFKEAQRLVRWHYQFIIVNQYLRFSLDFNIYKQVKEKGPTIFKPSSNPKIPREFQIAAFRFGHSQVRPGYKINVGFGAPIFDYKLDSPPNQPSQPIKPSQDPDPNDLRGRRRAQRRFVEWDTFFDFGTKEVAIIAGKPVVQKKVKKNKRIDPFLSSPLFDLPIGPGLPAPLDDVRSLAQRNLVRHLKKNLASGQAIAEKLGYNILTISELNELKFDKSTPLWYYILHEALVQTQGKTLGQVGSRIVAEVFFGLLESDKDSYWSQDKNWKPEIPQRNGKIGEDFTMTDLLTFARVG